MEPAADTDGSSELGAVFSAAAPTFSQWAPLLWDPMGAALTDFVAPTSGQHVLDACCGIGSSAFPAAGAVGAGGAVDAVDLAEGLLDAGRARVGAADLANVRFERADVTTWRGGPYDVVQCAYGVFLLQDMDGGGRHLVSLLKPGGRFGVAVWERGSLEDFGRALCDVAARHRPPPPGPPPGAGAISRVDQPGLLHQWLTDLGLHSISVHTLPGRVELDAERAWNLVLGSGFRQALGGMSEHVVAEVRGELLGVLDTLAITSVVSTSLVGVGVRP
jgi:SAM-dependent methyltransferase